MEVPSSLGEILEVAEETDESIKDKLVNIATKDEAVLLALIAPYVGVKVTPAKILRAHLGVLEEFGVETVIEQIHDKTDIRKLYLLINSPGGLIRSSYKVARAIRRSFDKIVVFVPHIAASGGTLVVLAGNEIVMGMMSQLTPLDPIKETEKGEVSALSVVRGFEHVTNFFKKVSPEDAPYPYRVIAEKYDAVEIDDAISVMEMMRNYAKEILEGSGYSKERCEEIADKLVSGFLNHDEVITFEKARKIGLNVSEPNKYPHVWPVFREWLGKYLLKSADKHIIRYVLPQAEGDQGERKGKERLQT